MRSIIATLLILLATPAQAIVAQPGDSFVLNGGSNTILHISGTTGDRTLVACVASGCVEPGSGPLLDAAEDLALISLDRVLVFGGIGSDGALLEFNLSTGQRTLSSSASEGVGAGPPIVGWGAGTRFATAHVSHSAPAFPAWALGTLSVLLIASASWAMGRG